MTDLPIIQSCDNCGACCRNQPCPPGFHHIHTGCTDLAWAEDVEIIAAAPAEVRESLRQWFAERERLDDWKVIDGQPCCWLTEDGRCRHYEHRPTLCREMEVGSEGCRVSREMHGID